MQAATVTTAPHRAGAADLHDPIYQSFMLLRIAFTVAPILFGLDKFVNVLSTGRSYLAR